MHSVFTTSGYNMYVLMLQQLYNWHVDWDFMRVWCPFHAIGSACIGSALAASGREGSGRGHCPEALEAGVRRELSDLCDRPMAPCQCKDTFPRARALLR